MARKPIVEFPAQRPDAPGVSGPAEQILSFLRIVGHVVEFVGSGGVAPDELPLPRADHAYGSVFVEHVDALALGDRPPLEEGCEGTAGQAVGHAVRLAEVLQERWQPIVLAKKIGVDHTRRHVTRPANQAGHLHAGVEHVLRPGGVALAVQAVVAHVHAVVAHEDDEGVFRHAVFVEPIQQSPDVAVHAVERGEVAGQLAPSLLAVGGTRV